MTILTFNQRLPNLRLQASLPPLGYALPLPRLALLTTLQQVVIPIFPPQLDDNFITANGEFITAHGESITW